MYFYKKSTAGWEVHLVDKSTRFATTLTQEDAARIVTAMNTVGVTGLKLTGIPGGKPPNPVSPVTGKRRGRQPGYSPRAAAAAKAAAAAASQAVVGDEGESDIIDVSGDDTTTTATAAPLETPSPVAAKAPVASAKPAKNGKPHKVAVAPHTPQQAAKNAPAVDDAVLANLVDAAT